MFSWTLYLVVVVVVSLAHGKKTEFEKEEGVLILNKDNYEKVPTTVNEKKKTERVREIA